VLDGQYECFGGEEKRLVKGPVIREEERKGMNNSARCAMREKMF
jgi:hypothetical protein